MSRVLAVSTRCGWVDDGETVVVARLPDGPPLVLDGPAALVWEAVLPGGDLEDVVARVADATGESADVVAPGVCDLVDGLVAAGVLVHRAPPAPADDD